MPAARASRITIERVNATESRVSADCESPSGMSLAGLGAGMTEEQILNEHPDLEKADFAAVYQFAADAGRRANLV
jgi:uncharacterized protein DUF433